MIAEIIGPSGRVHYRRPVNDTLIDDAMKTLGYTVRFVENETVERRPVADRNLTLNGLNRRNLQTPYASAKFKSFIGKKVMIWSQEHRAWWHPEGAGYTDLRWEAGIYDFEDAYRRTHHCGPEKQIAYVRA